MPTATPARIRRCNRDSEFAIAQNIAVLAARPDARPSGSEDFTVDSFFDLTSHGQALLTEKFSLLSTNRRNEAAESQEPLRVGTDIAVAPMLPRALMIDRSRLLNRSMLIKGLAIDFQTDRNSIETGG